MSLDESPRTGGKNLLRIIFPASGNLVEGLTAANEIGRLLQAGLDDLAHQAHGQSILMDVALVEPVRSDVLLQALRGDPSQPPLFDLDLKPVAMSLVDTQADVIVLTIEPDVMHGQVWMHRQSGYLLDLTQTAPLLSSDRRELEREWISTGLLDTKISTENFRHIVGILKDRTSAHIIGFNGSSLDPNDCTYNYYETSETTSIRIRKLNLSLLNLSIEEGISIVDVDRIVAELGGEGRVEGAFRYSPDLRRVIRRELLRVMEDIGFFDSRPLLQQVGQGKKA